MPRCYIAFIYVFLSISLVGQQSIIGTIHSDNGDPLAYATVAIEGTGIGVSTDISGSYALIDVPAGTLTLQVSYLGFETQSVKITVDKGITQLIDFTMSPDIAMMNEVVVTGTMKEVSRVDSPVPVEVYSPTFFKKNPTPNIYEALQNVNGVRPQLNCNVCNTGDIHINGLEGPYTMVLIDGMPIVSSLATVYGLSGIPNSLVERMEVVKGPASSLYGSEAIGGLINIITKNPSKSDQFSADVLGTSWGELNADLGATFSIGDRIDVLTGVNAFLFDHVVDNNEDNFTDMTLQERISIFQKWNIKRKDNKLFTIAGRYYHEDRWGGELQWDEDLHRGGDEVYGESIYTRRWELISQYQLPTTESLMLSVSLNGHDQNSVYGDTPYLADQRIAFGQLTWDKTLASHDLLLGTAIRHTYYDDNTPATGGEITDPNNAPNQITIPGLFAQDEITLSDQHKLLLGLRYDYDRRHGGIWTPRVAYKWSLSETDIFRINMGTGFRVVNLFTEDHAALTGSRNVVIAEKLEPEESLNVNLNYIKKIYMADGGFASLDISTWYTHFSNVILPDYETSANQIIYDNLNGHSVTKGVSANVDVALLNGLSLLVGGTLMDVSTTEDGVTERQILTERFSGTWGISYKLPNHKTSIDYTGNLYGPMRLPLLGKLDPRPADSPWWSIQNIQATHRINDQIELYGGVKNLLNWTPWKNQDEPIIARAFDPFDRQVTFGGADGTEVIPTPANPNALTFDPSYVYGPNQGIRGFFGIRYSLD